ncbi:hypothetical protein CVT26_010577 [Gymnopilus dilepis]|uniref:F-box domain-containing protein n=1 Tax=Gymnopilus dilepis TaxID=231916 RepID=A0A409VZH7_9AGAR|nr:hypothetical protein CVT26_010577 [Gymnopilus dilepis]
MESPNSAESSLLASFPFSSFLQTDYIPTKEEAGRVKEFLQKSEDRLRTRREKIECLYEEIERMEKDMMQLQAHIEACSSIISLARHIPDDILREIFCHCLPTDGDAVLDVNDAPLSLTLVCSRWRQVAITTPSLWSTIHIPIIREEIDGRLFTRTSPMSLDQAFQRNVGRANMVMEWLQRSGSTPLSISIAMASNRFEFRDVAPPPEFVAEYIKVIMPFATRWKALRLSGLYQDYAELAGLSETDVSSLESLTLDLHGFDDDEESAWRSTKLLSAPSLRKLSIRQCYLDLSLASPHLKRLTHLSLGPVHDYTYDYTPGLEVLSRILRECTDLISCRLHLRDDSWSNNGVLDICDMYLPSLKKLDLREGPNTLPLVEKLEVPHLEEIVFESSLTGAEMVLKTLVSRTNECLQKLNLRVVHLEASVFREVLHHSPNLTTLVLKQVHNRPSPKLQLDDGLLNELASYTGPSLRPRLEILNCNFEAEFTYQGFLDFIRRKQGVVEGPVAKLKEVLIHPVSERDETSGRMGYKLMTSDVKRFVDEGLSFYESINYDHNTSVPHVAFSAREGWQAYDHDD